MGLILYSTITMNLRKTFFFLLVALLSYFFLDQQITVLLAPYSKVYRAIWKTGTLLIFPPLYLAFFGGGFLIMRLKKSHWTLPFFEILLAQCLSVAFVRVFKIFIGRARPDIFLKKGVYGFHGLSWDHHFHSFPSGHTMAAFTLATSLSYLFPRYRVAFFSIAIILTISRIFLLGHFLSDVIGTAIIALLIGTGVHKFINAITRSSSYETV